MTSGHRRCYRGAIATARVGVTSLATLREHASRAAVRPRSRFRGRVLEATECAESALAFYRSVRATRFARELENLLEDFQTARA
jgi:hypothetical protein